MIEDSDVLTIVIRLGDDILQKLQMKFSAAIFDRFQGRLLGWRGFRTLEVVEVAFGKAR
jgi:hypothetical protein